jgi:hypothetical protein
MSHVTLGDLTPINIEEKAMISFITLNMTFFYAFCFANIASIVSDFLGNHYLQFHEKFSNVKAMIPKKKTPQAVISKVNSYYDFIWIHSHGFNEVEEIFNEVPSQLRDDLMKSRF